MLRHLLIITPSGLVVYKKEFVKLIAQPSMTGSLLATMINLALQTVKRPLWYIELTNVAVSFAVDSGRSNLVCALFHDSDDGADFGTMLAAQLLNAFVDAYPDLDVRSVLDANAYTGFGARIPDAIRGALRPILAELMQERGILSAAVTQQTNVLYSTSPVDDVGLLANLAALLSVTADILSGAGDACRAVTAQGNKAITHVRPLQTCTLIVAQSRSVNTATAAPAIDRAAALVDGVLRLLGSLAPG